MRKLHKGFKKNNWNSIRYCIGFPPEKWYEIADEEGLLIQDEFPIWTAAMPLDADTLTGELMAWMHEHVNYPCVAVWDSENESFSVPELHEAASRVRDFDLSKRPWDFGWSYKMRDGDVTEMHPYRAGRADFPRPMINEGGGLHKDIPPVDGEQSNPAIINEYADLWVNRDGTATRSRAKPLSGCAAKMRRAKSA